MSGDDLIGAAHIALSTMDNGVHRFKNLQVTGAVLFRPKLLDMED